MAKSVTCLLAVLALAPTVWGKGSIHHTIDDAFEHIGLNPVTRKANTKTGQVRAAVEVTQCVQQTYAGVLEGCMGLPNEPHPHKDPILQVGVVSIPTNGTASFPVRGTEFVLLPLTGTIGVANAHHQTMHAGVQEAMWLSGGSGASISLSSSAGVAAEALVVVYDTPLGRKEEVPHFQHYTAPRMGRVDLPVSKGSASVTLFSGAMHGVHGPAHSFTVALLALAVFQPGTVGELHVPAPKTGVLHVISGRGRLGGHPPGSAGRLGKMAAAGDTVALSHPTRLGGVVHDKDHPAHRFAKAGTGFVDDVWVHCPAGGEPLVLAVVGGLPAQHGEDVVVQGPVAVAAGEDLQGWLADVAGGYWEEEAGHFHSPTLHAREEEAGVPHMADLEAMGGYDPHDPDTTPPPHSVDDWSKVQTGSDDDEEEL